MDPLDPLVPDNRLCSSTLTKIESEEKDLAESVRNNELEELTFFPFWSAEAELWGSEGRQIADALRENTSVKSLRISALPTILRSLVCGHSLTANHSVEDLTLLVPRHSSFLSERQLLLETLKAVLSTNQTLKTIKLMNAHFSLSEWMKVVDVLKPDTHLQVVDIGESTGWDNTDFLNAMVIVKQTLAALNQELRLNSGKVWYLASRKGPPQSARNIMWAWICRQGLRQMAIYGGKSTLSETTMPDQRMAKPESSTASEQEIAETPGHDLFLQFNEYIKSTGKNICNDDGYIVIRKVSSELLTVARKSHELVYMFWKWTEEIEIRRVLCYLLGRAYTADVAQGTAFSKSILKVNIIDPTWLEPLCAGLVSNRTVESLHIDIDCSRTDQKRMADSLQEIPLLLEQGSSLKRLHIYSDIDLDGYENIAKAVRTNKLRELSLFVRYGEPRDTHHEIADALRENTSIRSLRIMALPCILNNFVGTNHCVEDLMLLEPRRFFPHLLLFSISDALIAALPFNQRLKKIKLVGFTFSPGQLMKVVEAVRPDMHLQVLDNCFDRYEHIFSVIECDGYEKALAEAVRNNELEELTFLSIWSGEAESWSSEGRQIADALRENTSVRSLRISALPTILQSLVCGHSLTANHSVKDLTLLAPKYSSVLSEKQLVLEMLKAALSTNQTLERIKLANAHFSLSEWMEVIDVLKPDTHLQVLDVGESTGWDNTDFVNAMVIVKQTLAALNRELSLNSGKSTFCETMIPDQSMAKPESSMASEQEIAETAGCDLFLQFNEYIKSTGKNICNDDGYISIWKVSSELLRVASKFRIDYRIMDEDEIQRVLCYLLGRAYTADVAQGTAFNKSILKVHITDPTWLEPLCAGLVSNQTVESLHIHIQTVLQQKRMADSLQEIPLLLEQGSSLKCLHIYSNIDLDQYEHIAKAVRTNKLSELSLSLRLQGEHQGEQITDWDTWGKQVADAFRQNTSIRRLRIMAFPCILKSFVGGDSSAGVHGVEDLTLLNYRSSIGFHISLKSSIFHALKAALSMNQTLRIIKLVDFDFTLEEWMEVVDALKPNKHLRVLDIGESTGWVHIDFFNAMFNLLRVHCTQIIDLGITSEYRTSSISELEVLKENLPALNRQLRLNSEYGEVLSRAEKGPPVSARVILCGPGYAGKTTLCNTMMRKPRQRASLFLQRNPRLWRFLYGTAAPEELEKRTRGVEMQVWREDTPDHPRICLWDFAGQKEYYALHDYMFPVVNCANLLLFCLSLVPGPLDTNVRSEGVPERISQIAKEFRFWLRFLCSNSKENINPKPRVCLILTNVDRVSDDDLDTIKLQCEMKLVEAFQGFETRVDLVTPIVFLNCHSRKMVGELEARILNEFAGMIPKLEHRYRICETVRRKLENHRRSGDPPIITHEQYTEICIQVDETMLRSPEVRDAVASYLHSVGEIIHFRSLKFVVVDPRWLGVEILGNLLDVFGRKSPREWKGVIGYLQASSNSRRPKIGLKNGFVKREGLSLLLNQSLKSVVNSMAVKPDYLIELLSALEICFEDQHRQGYHIPAALDDESDLAFLGRRQLQWNAVASGKLYIGRRLQCANDKITVLTSGFFPRLQVVLQRHLLREGIIGGHGFEGFAIQRNMLTFLHNGMNVIIEHGDGECFDHSFVDVMVKTSRGFEETVDFMENHVLTVIRDFCAQPEGNQGVTLVEGIVRPKSVEHLVLCRYRENQSILITELENLLVKGDDVFYQFYYNGVPEGYSGPCASSLTMPERAYALAAIKGEESLKEFEQQVRSDAQVISSAFEQVKEPIWPTVLTNLLDKQLLQGTPKLVYIIEDKTFYLFRGRNEVRLRLHLQCESREGPHVVDKQKGRSFVVEDDLRETIIPVVNWTYSLLKLGAATAGRILVGDGADTLVNNLLPREVPVLPSAFISYTELEELGLNEKEKIVQFYEEVLTQNPFSDWVVNFLNLKENPSKFKADFGLHEMRYNDTKEVTFLCNHCQIEALKSRKVSLP